MGALEAQAATQLYGTGLVLFRTRYDAEIGAGRIGVGRAETYMVEGVVDFEAELQFGALVEPDVLVKAGIHIVHAAGAHAAPAGGEGSHVGGEILIDAVLDAVAGGGLIAIAGQVLDTGPRGIDGNIGVFVGVRQELAGIEPPGQRSAARQRDVLAAEERVGAK